MSAFVGIGCDLVKVSRIQRLHMLYGERFLARAFNEREIEHFRSLRANDKRATEYLAARWAVKESLYKAIGGRWRLRFPDVYVARNERGTPQLVCEGDTAHRLSELGVGAMHVSITHETDYALAHVMLERAAGASEAAWRNGKN